MKKETVQDELMLLKVDFQTLQKSLHYESASIGRIVEAMREQIEYLYARLELKLPERRQCLECNGRGTFYISPVSDCGQSNECRHCGGKGFKYV